jgi:hypothetical protein
VTPGAATPARLAMHGSAAVGLPPRAPVCAAAERIVPSPPSQQQQQEQHAWPAAVCLPHFLQQLAWHRPQQQWRWLASGFSCGSTSVLLAGDFGDRRGRPPPLFADRRSPPHGPPPGLMPRR